MSLRFVTSCLLVALSACALPVENEDVGAGEAEIASAGAFYHLDAANGLGAATLTVVNGYKVHCPDGHFAATCDVSSLAVPADCGFECQDGLLGLQGESVVQGHFKGHAFVVTGGFDTYAEGLGTYSIYRITGAPTCAADPCPTGLLAQKLDTTAKPTAVKSVDFRFAADPNYVLDPTRGDAQIASAAGLLVSGHVVSHVFRVDRAWRLETPRPACDPQEVARSYAFAGEEVRQLRTVYEAERFVDPNQESVHWLVRSAETATAVTFTSGINDLWAQRFDVAKTGCAVTVTAEH